MSLLHKSENQQHNNDPLIKLMTQMIAGILACVFCLVSMTWAWFTASVDSGTQTLQSATRSTYVKVYEVIRSKDENGIDIENKTLVNPYEDENEASEVASLTEDEQIDKDVSVVMAGEPLVWELSPEKEYEVVMTGAGTASKGYCEVELSQTDSSNTTPQITKYKTAQFEKDQTLTFTYKTGGFSEKDGVTATEWKKSVENTKLEIEIASYWGKSAEESEPQVALMSARNTAEEEIMLLADGDVLGLDPIPCPEAKAESKVELEGFEIQEGAVISAEEDYKISLTLKEGYEMPSEVVVNIGGKDYVVSTEGADVSEDAPYYDAQTRVLTVPSSLLSDGIKVSVKAIATQIPAEEPEEEETGEEETEETTEETTDNNETEEDNSADTSSDNNVVVDNPTKKEEDGQQNGDEPEKIPAGDGGNDDDDDETDNSGDSSDGNDSSSEDETEDEKADVKLNLSQLTINLEETQIPTNADLVLTLSAKEDMELPERIVITLDKTIRDENIEDEEIEEDKTEYIINTDGKANPEGFEFDAESGELTISSELLKGVREITIADTERSEAAEDDEKAEITFEVKNLTFDFTDDEIVTDEDVVITFTAGEGYELPETIVITVDGEEYIIYTSEEDSDKNPEGITFDSETGTLTISKDLLEEVKAITITAEGVEKEDEESEDTDDKENEAEGGETTDKEPESGGDAPGTEDKTEAEGEPDVEGGEKVETTNPEANPDSPIEGEDEGETTEPDPEPTTPTEPDVEDTTEKGAEETTPGTESGGDGENTTPTEPTTPAEPSEPIVTPETPKTETPSTNDTTTAGNDGDDNGGIEGDDENSTESGSNSGYDSTESNTSSDSIASSSPSVMPPAPTTSAPATSETSTLVLIDVKNITLTEK